ncbi:MAG: hypothetical protein JO020_05920 [Chloroflexi bacterium]|nr:hypothetical protein [Chloroflexota bacterium]MBV9893682.1 hypothetical protein [Chloroflexota bacterium]
MTTTGPAAGAAGVVKDPTERAVAVAAAVRAERRAWLIIWVAFATLCALVFAAFKFAIDYVSTAQVDQVATVVASRGQVAFSLPGSEEKTLLGDRTDLGVGTVVFLDRKTDTSADVQLFDASKLKLLPGATLELSRMEVGRFINQHAVQLTQDSGPIRYATGDAVDAALPNATVHLAPHGDYTLWIHDDDQARVLVYSGEAHVTPASGGLGVTVAENHRAEVDANGQIQISDLPMPLINNGDFSQQDQGWQALDVPNSSLDVNGIRSWVPGPGDTGTALRVARQTLKGEHGETGLVQQLNNVDVSGWRHLWLRAWARVDYSDLSGGGTLNSEYPMIFRIKYEGPVEGSFLPWAIGLYYSNPDNRPIPENTAVMWPQQEWKLYQVDLMDTDSSRVPYRLQEFAVMGQGHSYDARVANISLVGE